MRTVLPVLLLALASGCSSKTTTSSSSPAGGAQTDVPATTMPITGHDPVAEDATPKSSPRLLPPETFVRSYLALFGGLSPLDAQTLAKGKDGALFDTWNDYLSSIGFPDYRVDLPRGAQTNALMLATFERVGIALCDRSVEHDWLSGATADQRVIFAFDPPGDGIDVTAFAAGFDVLHRTFLGYPAALAPTDRTNRFFQLYQDTLTRHADKAAPKKFTPAQSGWANVCYGLIRHPEFHLY